MENILAAFVFKCEKCGYEVRMIMAKLLKGKFFSRCYKCNDMRGFVFKRNGNQGADWVNLQEVQKVIDKLKTINT